MKKIFSVFLIGVLCSLTFASCSGDYSKDTCDFSELEFSDWGETNRLFYTNLDDLEKDSEIIVIGTFTDDTKQEEIYQYNSHFQKDILATIISTNSIEVLNVIKGDVKAGDTIPVTQDYGISDNQFIAISRLTPMLKGDTWLFFLSENKSEIRKGKYSCTGDNDGRYPLENFSYRKTALTDNENLGVYNKEDFREDIYKDILEKYDLK